MPRFSANLGFLWPDRPLLDRIEAAGRAGFRAVELHWPFDTPPEAVRDACGARGLTLLAVNTAVGDAAAGDFGLAAVPEREGDFAAAFDQALDWVCGAGGNAVHAMAGVVAPEDRTRAGAAFRANVAAAADKAAEAGIGILLEAINPRDKPGYFYSTVGEAAAFIGELGRPNVKLLFDAYHVGVAEGDILTKLRRHFDVVGHVQIAAVPSRAEPDEGEIAFPAIFAELDRLGYDGWVGCEYRPRGDTDAGLRWTERLGVAL